MSGSFNPQVAAYVYAPDSAWDELYDTRDGQPALPPPPRSPHQRRRRRVMLTVSAGLLCMIGIAIGMVASAVGEMTSLLGAIVETDTAVLQDRVAWPRLQTDLRTRLTQMALAEQAGSLRGAPPPAGTKAYLATLIEAIVTGGSRPETLAGALRQRAIPGLDAEPGRNRSTALPVVAALGVTAGPMLRIDLPGDSGVFPSGVGLCLSVQPGLALRLRLVGLVWPEFSQPC